MLDLPIEINSRDPVNDAEIWVRIDPGECAWWEPETAVVSGGSGCCDLLNFFESNETATRYLYEHAELAGRPISIPEAIETGRTVFGAIFKEA